MLFHHSIGTGRYPDDPPPHGTRRSGYRQAGRCLNQETLNKKKVGFVPSSELSSPYLLIIPFICQGVYNVISITVIEWI